MEQLVKEFNTFVQTEIKLIQTTYNTHKTSKNIRVANDYAKKFPFLKSKSKLPSLDEILRWETIQKKFDYSTQIEPILNEFISKITGLYKHGQTEKTGLCNLRIVSNVRLGKLTIAISKNTLDAKMQWEERLIKSLKEVFPNISLKGLILIISSKHNDLNGNATHCKTINDAIANFTRGNFKIIFICSNNTRINDILEFLKSYEGFSVEKRLPIDIQHDEAHNLEDGIPSKRVLIEHIIINPYVESYMPVTASYDTILNEQLCLWKKANIDMYAIDYTKDSQIVSTSPDYSSISDANALSFEVIRNHPLYKDYRIDEFDEDTFDEAEQPGYYSKMSDVEAIKADKKRRRQLEFCTFMKYEKDAYNLGMNILDNFYRVTYKHNDSNIETSIILIGVKNIHIITTPCRVALTISLMKYAISKDYSPICIGLYRSAIHIKYKDQYGQIINKLFSELSDECNSEELNNKIFDILEYIKKKGESIDRPILIMGNYKPTGESITFVNFKYGTIRSDTLLPTCAQTREKHYQGFLRSCYMDTKFRENSPGNRFDHPPKWIIGSQRSINDAVSYEKENDERIFRMKDAPGVELCKAIVPLSYTEDDISNISVPIKFMILDMDDILVSKLREIFIKERRSKDDKKEILNLLYEMINSGTATYSDPTGKFNFTGFVVEDVRCWKRKTKEEIDERIKNQNSNYKPHEDDWRFSNYDSNHTVKSPYLNDKRHINTNQCEVYAAYDKYEYKGFVNHKSCIWISYRF